MIHERAAGSAERFLKHFRVEPDIAVITGSGHSTIVDGKSGGDSMPASITDITELPPPSVAGHGSTMTMRTIHGKRTLFVSGRHHLYEGCSIDDICLVTMMCAQLRVRSMLYVNAAGGLHPALNVGDLVLVNDLMVAPMLRSPLPTFARSQPRDVLDPHWRESIDRQCLEGGFGVRAGTYVMVPGPSYETRAEIRMMRRMGADVIGMSTVLEAQLAAREGMNVAILSLVTNRLTDVHAPMLTHTDVVVAAAEAGAKVKATINSAILCA